MRKIMNFAIACAMCAGMSVNAEPLISVVARITPTSVVSGLRPSMQVHLVNLSTAPVTIPDTVGLAVVRLSDGLQFVTRFERIETEWNSEDPVLRPKGERYIEVPWASAFGDVRMLRPGDYEVRVLLFNASYDDYQRAVEEAAQHELLSKSVPFRVLTPQGDDAGVCEVANAQFHNPPDAEPKDGACWISFVDSLSVLADLMARYPASAYAPYYLWNRSFQSPEDQAEYYASLRSRYRGHARSDWFEYWRLTLPAISDASTPSKRAALLIQWQRLERSTSIPALRNAARRHGQEIGESD